MGLNETLNILREKLKEDYIADQTLLGETTVLIKKEKIIETLTWLKEEQGYIVFTDLSAVDYLKPEEGTVIFYLLQNPTTLERIRINVFLRRGEKLPSVTKIWEGADWYEREIYDMFGVHFENHPDLKRILMPLDWKGHPLRKDYALTEEAVEFKHGVKPKVPSEIIPHA